MGHPVESVSPILALLVVVASLSAAGTLLTRFSGPSNLALPAAGVSGLGFGPIVVAVIVATVGAIPVVALLLAAPTRRVY